MSGKCVNNPDKFCYICGEVIFSGKKCSITPLIQNAYHYYFGTKIDQDKSWVPGSCCNPCATGLQNWLSGKKQSFRFAVPMQWREPTNHSTDCYFCLTTPIRRGVSKKKKSVIVYPNTSSVNRPQPHSDGYPIPERPKPDDNEIEEDETSCCASSSMLEYVPSQSFQQPHKITQSEFNDLVRDLKLPNAKAELLGSRLQQRNMLEDDVSITSFCSRQKTLMQ